MATRSPRAGNRKSVTPIETLLHETRTFKPNAAFTKVANASSAALYKQAQDDPIKFWEEMASQLVWKKKWTKALEWNPPDAKWFVGGKLNVTE
jgi:acetyl-CoA synthetase